MTADQIHVPNITSGAKKAVAVIAVLLGVYGGLLGFTVYRATETARDGKDTAEQVARTQRAVQTSRREACAAANKGSAKLRNAIHTVFLSDTPSERTKEAVALFDEALAPRDCQALTKLKGH